MQLRDLSQTLLSTPLGKVVAMASERGLCLLTFQENKSFIQKRLTDHYPLHRFGRAHQRVIENTKAWLADYFAKKFTQLEPPPFDLQGTGFTINAWRQLLRVPIGNTLSYGALAKTMGTPKAVRAVGRAMGQNPIVLLIPCHRIIGSDGTLTGFSCGLDRKIWLLKHEGLLIQ